MSFKGNRARNAEQWHKHVKAFRTSGLTHRAFCKERKLHISALGYWLQRFEGPKAAKPALAPSRQKGFIPVAVTAGVVSRDPPVRVILRDGTVIEGGDLATIAKLAAALRGGQP